ncbi:MAG: RsmD family RNA methyltransferase [Polyangiales bacterium]
MVGGELRGRRFRGPVTRGTRATSDRVREALASALDARDAFAGARVLDLFAGTGALTFEALSRGARHAVAVERDRRAATSIRRSAAELGLRDRVRVLGLDLRRDPREIAARLGREGGPYDLVLADPPYDEVECVAPLIRALAAAAGLAPDALVAIEHASRQAPEDLRGLASVARYEYGDTAVWLLTARHGETDG